MASAATNSNPVGIVRSTVLEFPAMVIKSDAPASEDVTLVGTIVSVDEDAKRVELDTGEVRVAVDIGEATKPAELPAPGAAPVTVGSVVEVDGSLPDGDTTVRAREVRVKEPVASAVPAERNDLASTPGPTTVKPVVVADEDRASNLEPATPSATPTPPGDETVKPAIVANATPRPTLTPTPSPVPTATATQTPTLKPRPTPMPPVVDPVPPDEAETDNSNLVGSETEAAPGAGASTGPAGN
jgi:hypothetical protein